MRGTDFKDRAKETAGIRNVFFEKDAENLVGGKEKQSAYPLATFCDCNI